MKRQLKIWLECFRLRTLPVSLSGVVIAIGLAKWHHHFQWVPALLCLAFALLAQIVSNTANEYFDYLQGTDKPGRVGPRRGVTEGDIKPTTLRNVTFGLMALACAVGCCLIPYGGWWLLPVGIIIALAALAYSTGPYPLSYHGLGEDVLCAGIELGSAGFTHVHHHRPAGCQRAAGQQLPRRGR